MKLGLRTVRTVIFLAALTPVLYAASPASAEGNSLLPIDAILHAAAIPVNADFPATGDVAADVSAIDTLDFSGSGSILADGEVPTAFAPAGAPVIIAPVPPALNAGLLLLGSLIVHQLWRRRTATSAY